MAIASVELLIARRRGHFDSIVEQAEMLLRPDDGRTSDGGRTSTDTAFGTGTALSTGTPLGTDTALGSDLKAVTLLNLGVTEAWSLRLADSERHLAEGAALARRINRPYLEVACLAHLGFASTVHSFALARQRCEEAIEVAAGHSWDAEPVIAPALAGLANVLAWTGRFDLAEQWLDRARRATHDEGEPGVRLLVRLTAATLRAARGQWHRALEEFAAARQVQDFMVGEHGLTARVDAWTIAARARLGMTGEARAALAALDDRRSGTGEIRNAAATVLLAERDPAAARRELRSVLDGDAPVLSHLTRIEAHLLDAFACRDLGDEHASREAAEQALNLAEPDRLILPFAMTGADRLLTAVPRHGTSHAALITDIVDAVRDPGRRTEPNTSPAPPVRELSRSELRVLRYLPTHLTRRDIAGELSVSLNTIDTHIRRIYAKLGVADGRPRWSRAGSCDSCPWAARERRPAIRVHGGQDRVRQGVTTSFREAPALRCSQVSPMSASRVRSRSMVISPSAACPASRAYAERRTSTGVTNSPCPMSVSGLLRRTGPTIVDAAPAEFPTWT